MLRRIDAVFTEWLFPFHIPYMCCSPAEPAATPQKFGDANLKHTTRVEAFNRFKGGPSLQQLGAWLQLGQRRLNWTEFKLLRNMKIEARYLGPLHVGKTLGSVLRRPEKLFFWSFLYLQLAFFWRCTYARDWQLECQRHGAQYTVQAITSLPRPFPCSLRKTFAGLSGRRSAFLVGIILTMLVIYVTHVQLWHLYWGRRRAHSSTTLPLGAKSGSFFLQKSFSMSWEVFFVVRHEFYR